MYVHTYKYECIYVRTYVLVFPMSDNNSLLTPNVRTSIILLVSSILLCLVAHKCTYVRTLHIFMGFDS